VAGWGQGARGPLAALQGRCATLPTPLKRAALWEARLAAARLPRELQRRQLDRVVDRDHACQDRPRQHRALTLDRKAVVDGEQQRRAGGRGPRRRERQQRGAQVVDALQPAAGAAAAAAAAAAVPR
jgi:hypothetical protein